MNPFTDCATDTVGHIGENGVLPIIRESLAGVMPPAPHGMGDDCAVLPPVSDPLNLVTTDGVIFGIHFNEEQSSQDAGAKLLKRNLSDIAAMGGRPHSAVVSLLLPANTSVHWLTGFHEGLRRTAEQNQVTILGGDVAQSCHDLAAHLTLWGHAKHPITRTGAKIGDALLVTGSLGGSSLGKHHRFSPRLAEGRWLAKQTAVRSMIDLSDGIGKDLPALLPDDCSASIDLQSLPISDDARALAKRTGQPVESHAMNDGEDYELLFTVKSDTDINLLVNNWQKIFQIPLSPIGKIRAREKSHESFRLFELASGKPIKSIGYEHFRTT